MGTKYACQEITGSNMEGVAGGRGSWMGRYESLIVPVPGDLMSWIGNEVHGSLDTHPNGPTGRWLGGGWRAAGGRPRWIIMYTILLMRWQTDLLFPVPPAFELRTSKQIDFSYAHVLSNSHQIMGFFLICNQRWQFLMPMHGSRL